MIWFINVKKICKKIFLDLFGRLPFYIVEMCRYVNSPWWQKHMVLMREQYTYIPMIYQTSLEVWLFEIQMLMSAGIFSAKELKQESKIKIFFFLYWAFICHCQTYQCHLCTLFSCLVIVYFPLLKLLLNILYCFLSFFT